MNDKLERTRTTVDPAEGQVEIGQWYWVTSAESVEHEPNGEVEIEETSDEDVDLDEPEHDDSDHTATADEGPAARWLGCVTHVGSNYVQLTDPADGKSTRVHYDGFWTRLEHEPNAEAVIAGRIRDCQQRVDVLMGRVQQIAALLAVTPNPALHHAGAESAALAVRMEGRSYDEYKASLVKAKEEELPDLFKQIKSTHERLACWMSATVLPMKARFKGLREIIGHIENRIFTVQLYAGLVEEIVQIADGSPAELTEKIHLLQRRHYMDEECLAAYETGGMEFKDLRAFERWLVKPTNRDRLLPFPRCIVSFRVRRKDKQREAGSLADFIRIFHLQEEDKQTFLYIRNGRKIYRLQTEIEFEEQLFPDSERSRLHGKLWARDAWGHLDAERIISDDEYRGLVEEYGLELAAHRAEVRRWKRLPKAERDKVGRPWFSGEHENPEHRYSPFDKGNLYFDDIAHVLSTEVQKHNRIALVIQGLLDRSPILHPHPPWRLWTQEGYAQALVLVYDDSRALAPGERPDFETYRARLNAQLRSGSITIGQQDLWLRHEAKKLYERRSYRHSQHRPDKHRPWGNPGPGHLATVAHFSPKKQICTYRWEREGTRRASVWWKGREPAMLPTTFTCPAKGVLNVSAYTPGDFRLFFNDPRTRADYLEWAPLLLTAEEYHAGNRGVGSGAD